MHRRERVFLRGLTSPQYELSDRRQALLGASRVRSHGGAAVERSTGHWADTETARTRWRLGPGDEPFLTQSLQVHFVELESGGSNRGHGHQNEAAFYILKGKGFEIHDGQRYDWEKGDLVVVHNDSVHRHFNNSADPALALVIKAKSTWMLLGLVQQGPALQDFEGQYGRREDWSKLWSPDAVNMKKVVKPSASEWQTTRDGRVRILCSQDRRDVRIFSVDLYEQEIPAGSRSAKHWHMADEVLYVVSGRGYSLHWEVEAEITDRYYARVPNEPTEHRFNAGDLLYVPANCIHQHFNDSAEAPLVLLSGQNRLFKLLGYDSTAYLEDAPEYAARR